MAHNQTPPDDQLTVSQSPGGRSATVTFSKPGPNSPDPEGEHGWMTVRVPIADADNKTGNQIKAEAREKARELFRDLIRAYRGKDD